jgi:DNA-binding CsgD family transcriptional regulator
MATRFILGNARLTRRQREVITMLADGYSNREIADALDISLDGAKWHVGEILVRLNVDSREAAVAWWRNAEHRGGTPSRSLWAIAFVLPWKLMAAVAGVFGASSALRPRITTDEAALLRETAVTETWMPPDPPPFVISPAVDSAAPASSVRNSGGGDPYIEHPAAIIPTTPRSRFESGSREDGDESG